MGRYEKMDVENEDAVIYSFLLLICGVRGKELVIATDEPPESLANRPLLPLLLTLHLVKLFRLGRWWWRWRLGHLGKFRKGGSRVLARELEDAFPTGQFMAL